MPVLRADGAGESYVFSQFCEAVAPDLWDSSSSQLRRTTRNASRSTSGRACRSRTGRRAGATPRPRCTPTGSRTSSPTRSPGRNSITMVAAGLREGAQQLARSRRCRTRPDCSPSRTRTTSRSRWATPRPIRTRRRTARSSLNFDGPDPRAYFPVDLLVRPGPDDRMGPRARVQHSASSSATRSARARSSRRSSATRASSMPAHRDRDQQPSRRSRACRPPTSASSATRLPHHCSPSSRFPRSRSWSRSSWQVQSVSGGGDGSA